VRGTGIRERDLLPRGDIAERADDEDVVDGVLDVLGDGRIRVVVQAAQAQSDGAVPVPLEVVLVDEGCADDLALRGGEAEHRAFLDDVTGGDGHGCEHPTPVKRRRGDVRPVARRTSETVGWLAHGG
jgi:hypothetical protein